VVHEARALYQVAPAEFVAARNRLVKEMKAAGRRDDAAAVAGLRRPRLAEHGLNLVAASQPVVVADFAEAVRVATDAQRRAIEHGEGAALRSASESLRAATAAIIDAAAAALDAAGDNGAAQRMELAEILRGTLGDAAVDLLRQGIVGSATSEDDGDLLAGEPMRRSELRPQARSRSRRPDASSPVEHEAGPRAGGTAKSGAQRREEAQLARERAAERRHVERELSSARRDLDIAEREVARAQDALRVAEEALKQAQEQARTARVAVADLDTRRAALA
jgi:hypothetical protein